MNYNTLEAITRRAVCNTLGARSKDFDQWLVTFDSIDGIKIDGFDFGAGVELYFDPEISPFSFFSSEVSFFISEDLHTPRGVSPADVQVFFGNRCSNVAEAEKAAGAFLDRFVEDGWYVEDEFDECGGLHLRYELGLGLESEEAFATALEKAFGDLLDPSVTNALRSFIHYFED